MKTSIFFKSVAVLLIYVCSYSQNNNFNINDYKNFLNSHRNLEYKDFLSTHPAGYFLKNIKSGNSNALYLDSLSIKYNLTNYEKSLINKNGFMVSERLSFESFGAALSNIYHKDMPVFISVDMILHSIHRSYDDILKDVELNFLIPRLENILNALYEKLPDLFERYKTNFQMMNSLNDIDVYITLSNRLIGNNIETYLSSNMLKVIDLEKCIKKETLLEIPLFSQTSRKYDFSQFITRGHYTDNNYPQLAKYFKTMIWIGRTEFYLIAPTGLISIPESDVQRQVIDAALIFELFNISNMNTQLSEFNTIINRFVGESDNVTLENIGELLNQLNISIAGELLDIQLFRIFQNTLKTKPYADQKILSQVLICDPSDPDATKPASAFLLSGQRFIIDSYVLSQVVYDKIYYKGQKIDRLFPSTLDILYSIGNDASAQLLKEELEIYKYSSNLLSLRYLIDFYNDEFWSSTIYNLWLNSIRKLNPPKNRINLPEFMQTSAYWQQKINTQLASWSQLRHDNLLYAKQSYTGGFICSFPYSYVEPVPEFYNAIKEYATKFKNFFKNLPFSVGAFSNTLEKYFNEVISTNNTLYEISIKELNGIPFTSNEITFLKQMLSIENGCVTTYFGWYPRLFYYGEQSMKKRDYIVADIHTIPTDKFGNPIGWVMHSGTGPINLGVFIAKNAENKDCAFIGPFLSYNEYTTLGFKRLTDEEWETLYQSQSLRPSFVNSYLADKSGNSRGEGPSLLTGIKIPEGKLEKINTIYLYQNFPNPFNSTTTINFTIPNNFGEGQVNISIYNTFGQKVRILINSYLREGNYVVRWDGKNDKNIDVPSGIYYYYLVFGNQKLTGKMNLLK